MRTRKENSEKSGVHLVRFFSKESLGVHLIYLTIIFVGLLFAVIVLLSKSSVSESVFQSVSFAATIVSIVLAVLSIMISMEAAFKTSGNLSSLKETEKKVSESTEKLNRISESLAQLRHDVRKLSVQANLVKVSIEEKAIKKIEDSRYIRTTASDNNAPEDIEELVLQKLAAELGVRQFEREYRLRDKPRFIFDGYATLGPITLLVEIKYCSKARNVEPVARNFVQRNREAMAGYDTSNVLILLVIVCGDNDKEGVNMELIGNVESTELPLHVILYNRNELAENDSKTAK